MKRDPKERNALESNMWMPLLVKRVPGRAPLEYPRYESAEAAGFDLRASFQDPDDSHTLWPGDAIHVGCGFRFGIPPGFQLEIRPRSGLAFKSGVTIMNAPGTIDSDFTGEVVLMLCRPIERVARDTTKTEMGLTPNVPNYLTPIRIGHGDRIAQAVLMPVIKGTIIPTEEELPETARGNSGLGSTGQN